MQALNRAESALARNQSNLSTTSLHYDWVKESNLSN